MPLIIGDDHLTFPSSGMSLFQAGIYANPVVQPGRPRPARRSSGPPTWRSTPTMSWTGCWRSRPLWGRRLGDHLTVSVPPATELIPHRPAVSCSWTGWSGADADLIVGYKRFRARRAVFSPATSRRNPVVPGVLLVECLAQCGGRRHRRAERRRGFDPVSWATVEKAKFRRQVRPGGRGPAGSHPPRAARRR